LSFCRAVENAEYFPPEEDRLQGEINMAEIISYETVHETWQRMADTPSEEVQALVDQMEREQPALMVYLLALDDFPFNQNEKEIIYYIGTVLWLIMKKSRDELSAVPQETISKAEEDNYQFMEMISNDTEADFMSATQAMIDSYGEPEVLRYLVEALMEGEDEYYYEEDDQDLTDELLAAEMEEENNGFGDLFQDAEEEDIEVEIIYESEEDEEDADYEGDELDIRPELRGMAFVHLKTALDALIATREAEG
jgi:hypothetical protein